MIPGGPPREYREMKALVLTDYDRFVYRDVPMRADGLDTLDSQRVRAYLSMSGPQAHRALSSAVRAVDS